MLRHGLAAVELQLEVDRVLGYPLSWVAPPLNQASNVGARGADRNSGRDSDHDRRGDRGDGNTGGDDGEAAAHGAAGALHVEPVVPLPVPLWLLPTDAHGSALLVGSTQLQQRQCTVADLVWERRGRVEGAAVLARKIVRLLGLRSLRPY